MKSTRHTLLLTALASIAAAVGAEAGAARLQQGSATTLLRTMPDLCGLLTAAEAEAAVGAAASVPASGPGSSGEKGSLCIFRAARDRELGFELVQFPLEFYDPESDPIEKLVAMVDPSGKGKFEVWADAPGRGGYLAQDERGTTGYVVTPYQGTAVLSDRPTTQVLLRLYVTSPAGTAQRRQQVARLAELLLPRIAD